MRRAAWLRLLACAALAAALWGVYLKFAFIGFDQDPVWYLEPARSFALGHGLKTRLLYPAQLAQLAQFAAGIRPPVTPLHHGPLALVLIGLMYKAFGLVDCAPLAFSFGLTMLTGLLIYRLGRELGSERTGLLSAALWWSSLLIMQTNVDALTDAPFTFLIALGAVFLWESAKPRAQGSAWAAAAGLCVGLASCTRLAGQAYWAGFLAAALWLHRGAWRRAGALLAGLAAPLIPLALYNHRAAGVWFNSPGIYVLLWSRSFPGFRASTSFMNLTSAQALLAYPLDALQKLATGPLYAANRFLESAKAPYLGAAVFLGALSDLGDGAAERFRRAALLIAAPVVLLNILISYGDLRYLQPLFPLLIPLAVLFIWKFLDANARVLPGRAWWGVPVFALLFLSPWALATKEAWKTRTGRLERRAEREKLGAFLRERTSEKEVIYTDDPPTVVWHGDRAAVSLTATLGDAEKTFARLPPDALVMTSARVWSEDYDPAWLAAFEKRAPIMGFQPCAEFETPGLKALLYRRACPKP